MSLDPLAANPPPKSDLMTVRPHPEGLRVTLLHPRWWRFLQVAVFDVAGLLALAVGGLVLVAAPRPLTPADTRTAVSLLALGVAHMGVSWFCLRVLAWTVVLRQGDLAVQWVRWWKPNPVSFTEVVGICKKPNGGVNLWLGDHWMVVAPPGLGSRQAREWLYEELRRRIESHRPAAARAGVFQGVPSQPAPWLAVVEEEDGSCTVSPPGWGLRLSLRARWSLGLAVSLALVGISLALTLTADGDVRGRLSAVTVLAALISLDQARAALGGWSKWRVGRGWLECTPAPGFSRWSQRIEAPAILSVEETGAPRTRSVALRIRPEDGKRQTLFRVPAHCEQALLMTARWLSDRTGFPLEPPWEPV